MGTITNGVKYRIDENSTSYVCFDEICFNIDSLTQVSFANLTKSSHGRGKTFFANTCHFFLRLRHQGQDYRSGSICIRESRRLRDRNFNSDFSFI